jgi:hypothetical protein
MALPDGVMVDAAVFAKPDSVQVIDRSGFSGHLLKEISIIAFSGKAEFHAVRLGSYCQPVLCGDLPDHRLFILAQWQVEIGQPLALNPVKEVALVPSSVDAPRQMDIPTISDYAGIMAGGKMADAEFFLQRVPHDGKLEDAVAIHARAGCSSFLVFLPKPLDYLVPEDMFNINEIVGQA